MKTRRQGSRIPGYRAYGGVLIVPAILNGDQTADMIVDSGAGYCCITPEMARLLGYDLSHPPSRRFIYGAQGVEAEVPSFRLQSLQVEGIVIKGLEARVMTFAPRLRIDGLLGVNFLERFRPT
ncbi:MAG: retropepsin-like aspartic protease, partial [candidate division WOR-3 bacterium]